jgi:hypothetical protein
MKVEQAPIELLNSATRWISGVNVAARIVYGLSPLLSSDLVRAAS